MIVERQIGFLYPPVYLFGSMALGLYFDETRSLMQILPPELSPAAPLKFWSLVIASIAATLASKFVIDAVSTLLMSAAFRVGGQPRYEAVLSQATLDAIRGRLGLETGTGRRRESIYLSASLIEELPLGLRDWVARRWNVFTLGIQTVTALMLALVLGRMFGIAWSTAWVAASIVLMVIFLVTAAQAWRETMGMIEFQAARNLQEMKR